MCAITDAIVHEFIVSLPSAPPRVEIEESETSPHSRARQDPGGSGGGGGSPATIAETGHEATAGAPSAPFTRCAQHDLRHPGHQLDADAWRCGACHETFWVGVAHTPTSCPRCEHHAARPALPVEERCSICTGTHAPTQCPEVALAKYGMGVWESYMENKAAFLKLIQWVEAPRLLLMGDAVAFYLSHRWGRPIAGYHVLRCWRAA